MATRAKKRISKRTGKPVRPYRRRATASTTATAPNAESSPTSQRDNELWAARVTAEESVEMNNELTAALAHLLGEQLIPCGRTTDGKLDCIGHLGEKASAAIREATTAWENLAREKDRLVRQLATDRGEYDKLATAHAALLREWAATARLLAAYREKEAVAVEASGPGVLALAT